MFSGNRKLLLIFASVSVLSALIFSIKYRPPVSDLKIGEAEAQTSSTDWPQLQKNSQRTGFTNENLDVPISQVWAHGFSHQDPAFKGYPPERVAPYVQPVIVNNRVFLGTTHGTFYAFDAANGNIAWVYPRLGQPRIGPIVHTAGVEGGKVFFGSLDGNVYALNVSDGTLVWKFTSGLRTGFSTAVLLAENKVFIANRGGLYYALNQSNGSKAWERNVGSPILMSSAYDSGKLFFGAMDMKVYALNSSNGMIAWTSSVIRGQAFKDYWPVVHQGYILINPWMVEGMTYPHCSLPDTASGFDNQACIDYLTQNPHRQTTFVLNSQTGKEDFIIPHWISMALQGTVPPPAVDANGYLVMPAIFKTHRGTWAKLNFSTRKVVEVLWDGTNVTENPTETVMASVAGPLTFTFAIRETGASFTGVWSHNSKKWTKVNEWNAEIFFNNNTQGNGGSPVAISNGRIFHVTTKNTLNARQAVKK